jgi:hypothetical protein
MVVLWGSCQHSECGSHYAEIFRLDHGTAGSFAWMKSTVLDTVSISSVRIVNCNVQCVIWPECYFWNTEWITEPERVNVTESATYGWQNCLYSGF